MNYSYLPSVVSSPFPIATGTRNVLYKGKTGETSLSVLEFISIKAQQVQQPPLRLGY